MRAITVACKTRQAVLNWPSLDDRTTNAHLRFDEQVKGLAVNAIYLVVDGDYRLLACALAIRLKTLSTADVHIFIEGHEDNGDIISRLPAGVHLHCNILMAGLPDRLPQSEKWPRIIFGRLMVPEILSGYRRLLYLDVDTLPTERLNDLWGLKLPNGFGAVADLDLLAAALGDRGDATGQQGGQGPYHGDPGNYLNSGVLLLDAGVLGSSRGIADQLTRYFEQYGLGSGMFDQDFLNHRFAGRWDQLSPRWNFQWPLFGLGFDEWLNPMILHFNRSPKPWHPEFDAQRPQISHLYRDMVAQAGFGPNQPIGKPYRRSRWSRLRQSVRRHVRRSGVVSGRERRLLKQAHAMRDRYLAHFGAAVRTERYVDPLPPPFARVPSLDFDGRNLVADQSYVMSKVSESWVEG